MSEMRHTTAPWIVNTARTVGGANGDIAVVDDHGTILAVAFFRNDQTLANARLIAAAPELLKAAEDAVSMLAIFSRLGAGLPPLAERTGERLRAAIAKARATPMIENRWDYTDDHCSICGEYERECECRPEPTADIHALLTLLTRWRLWSAEIEDDGPLDDLKNETDAVMDRIIGEATP